MLKNLLYTTSFLFCFIACQTKTTNINDSIAEAVATLSDKKSQRAFLEKIAASDQRVRDEEIAINQKYGYKSKEHQQAIQKQIDTDKSNLAKIEAYLEKYGHPNKLDHGNRAFYAPWIVMHHAPKETGTRRRNFKYLYDYYKKDELEQDRLNFFLGRMHQLKFGGRIRWNRSFTVQEELDSLINVLDLRTVADEIDSNY
ncbi:MAG: hypothetical protein AB8G86_24645 [Saprospiraceae bacterium]